jgi:CubicO group peptidase (beta-lactamase class C family)
LVLNGDDPLTTYYPDQRKLALERTRISDLPGARFRYQKHHPQLLGMILERTTGRSVTSYPQTRLWDRLGMEFEGSWSLDSDASGFEKMETGVNARAIDFAKLGVLYLNGGRWHDTQIISGAWVAEATQPYFPQTDPPYYPEAFAAWPGRAYYGYMWWGMARDGAAYDFTAAGDKGQYIYVSPHKKLVIVRNGIHYGLPSVEWLKLFYRFASEY